MQVQKSTREFVAGEFLLAPWVCCLRIFAAYAPEFAGAIPEWVGRQLSRSSAQPICGRLGQNRSPLGHAAHERAHGPWVCLSLMFLPPLALQRHVFVDNIRKYKKFSKFRTTGQRIKFVYKLPMNIVKYHSCAEISDQTEEISVVTNSLTKSLPFCFPSRVRALPSLRG